MAVAVLPPPPPGKCVRSHFELVRAEPGPTPDSYVVTLTVTSDRFNGTGPLNFEPDDQ